MKKYHSLAITLAVPLAILINGCDRTSQDTGSSPSNTNANPYDARPADTNAMASYATNTAGRDVDNSGINDRDRDTNNLTPGDQGNTQADIDLTQKIRKSLVMDTTYSMTAKNIKIITLNGRVTLRGPVNSDSEKSGIEALAKNIAGDGNVDDQIEVKSNP
jgi:hyperosmotically inducible periplasmic protein